MTQPDDGCATYYIPELAAKLGVPRGFAYEQAKTGSIAGIPVIRIGTRLVVSRAVADRVLRGEPVEAMRAS